MTAIFCNEYVKGKNFTPLKFVKHYFSKTENYYALVCMHIRHSNLHPITKFHLITDVFLNIMRAHPQNFPFSLKSRLYRLKSVNGCQIHQI